MIGLALTACGGHHEHEHDRDRDDNQSTDTTAAPAKPTGEHEEHKEHSPKHEEHTEAPKDTVATEKGMPTANTTDAEKPKDASTMGSTETKHHVKPGGVKGNTSN
jgi:hypothetical protein